MNTTPTTRPVRAGVPRRWNRATAAMSAAIVAGTALAACSHPAPGQVAIDAVSVNQSVQSVDDRVPLITGKTTFVIVYLRAGGANIANIGGRLNVAGFNEVQPLTRRVTAVTTGYNPRGLDSALIFRLPAPMTVAGTRTANIDLTLPSGVTSPTGADGHIQSHSTLNLTFGPHDAPALTLSVLRYTYTNVPADVQARFGLTGPTWPVLSRTVIEQERQVAENILPLAVLHVDYTLEDQIGVRSYDCAAVGGGCSSYETARSDAGREIDQAFPQGGHWVVLYQPEHNGDGHGLTCMTAAGNHRINLWADAAASAGSTLAHELGHSLGLAHTPSVNQLVDPNYPRADGSMGPYYGIKIVSGPTIEAGQTASGGVALHDIMSYSPPTWVSPYSYCNILRVTTNNALLCPPSLDGTIRDALGTSISENHTGC
jgi:hypothetical protein